MTDVRISKEAQKAALEKIRKEGYQACQYNPCINHEKDLELYEALELLRKAGFIIIDLDGCIVGEIIKNPQ